MIPMSERVGSVRLCRRCKGLMRRSACGSRCSPPWSRRGSSSGWSRPRLGVAYTGRPGPT